MNVHGIASIANKLKNVRKRRALSRLAAPITTWSRHTARAHRRPPRP
ncbi:hypothetical protein SALB1_2359 [Salinisphaera sp. LB1]|nr:hypothetical protein SALB1_2359 [Salinisphaera sp. LB1]